MEILGMVIMSVDIHHGCDIMYVYVYEVCMC